MLGSLKVWDNEDVKFFCRFLHSFIKHWLKAKVYSLCNPILSVFYEQKEKIIFIRSFALVSTVHTGLDELIKFCAHQPPLHDVCSRKRCNNAFSQPFAKILGTGFKIWYGDKSSRQWNMNEINYDLRIQVQEMKCEPNAKYSSYLLLF